MQEILRKAVAWCLAIALVVSVFGALLFKAGPFFETRFAPVVGNVQALPIEIDRDRQVVHIGAYGTKMRQCEWKAITAMVLKNGVWHQGQVYFEDPRKSGTPLTAIPVSRPVGAQSLGEIFVFPAGEKVQVYLYHDCHPLWQTTTFLYELDFSKSPSQTR